MTNRFQSTVKAISQKGTGIVVHPTGQLFFVPGVWTGDEGEFEIISIDKRFGFARLINLISPSKDRISSSCPHHGFIEGECGGCPWLFVDYFAQLKEKSSQLKYQLERAGVSLTESKVAEILPSPQVFSYRNRAQLKTDGKKIGFVSHETHKLAEIKNCIVLNDKMQALLKSAIGNLPKKEWEPQHGFDWNLIDLDDEMSSEEIAINKKRPFRQGNNAQNSAMKRWLLQELEDDNKEQTVVELFAGSGNFTEVLSELQFKKIIAAELDGDALTKLMNKKLPHVEPIALDLYSKDFWPMLSYKGENATTLLLDPPREGFKNKSGLKKGFKQLKKIIYISCDLASFAKDCKELEGLGFHLKKVQGLDQFPHTPHLEILSVLERTTR